MKGVAEIPLIGIIGTFTIVLSVLAPPLIIQSAMYRDLDRTYNFQTEQNGLLALTTSTTGKQSTYESIGLNYISGTPQDPSIKNNLDKVLGKNYCLSLIPDGSAESTALISSTNLKICPPYDTQFNTVFVLPYNKDKPLVQVLGVGAK